MCDAPRESTAAHATHAQRREEVADRLRALTQERAELDLRRQQITHAIHQVLRDAHDLGWSWAEIAVLAGYRNAAVARNQAARDRPEPDPGPSRTYTVREAAERLGVSPPTIYAWIESGKLEVAVDRARGRRVLLPHDAESTEET